MPKGIKFVLIVLGAIAGLFAALFTVYFFNLDMKLTSKLQPLFEKHYDRMERNRKL